MNTLIIPILCSNFQGKYTFDPVSKLLTWDIGKVDPQKPPNIHGTVNLQSGSPVPGVVNKSGFFPVYLFCLRYIKNIFGLPGGKSMS